MIMAQETRNVDYESMVDKYMNEWEGCNLREFCFSEKVNIYRMLKTMKKMGEIRDGNDTNTQFKTQGRGA